MTIQKTFKSNDPKIYLVTTPIGNLSDISFRSIEVLKNVDVIYCEDTRTSARLLREYNILTKTKSLHKFNEKEKVKEITEFVSSGHDIAIISDAGVPGINDPGMILINEILKLEPHINVTAVGAGPAYVHALISSGRTFDKSYYLGFVNRKETKIIKEITNLSSLREDDFIAICFYESVHRIKKTLEVLNTHFKNKNFYITIARELTKINEEIVRMHISELEDYLSSENLVEKGEFCVVINMEQEENIKNDISEETLKHEFDKLVEQGMRKKEALKELNKTYNFIFEKMYKKF